MTTTDLALVLLRGFTGAFFVVAGYRKLTATKLQWADMCDRLGLPLMLNRSMPWTQIFGGIGLFFPFAPILTALAALGLLFQMAGAFALTTYPRLCETFPVKRSSGFIMNTMQAPEALLSVVLVAIALGSF